MLDLIIGSLLCAAVVACMVLPPALIIGLHTAVLTSSPTPAWISRSLAFTAFCVHLVVSSAVCIDLLGLAAQAFSS